jgi:AcrR family transcriptional regulator
MSFIFNLGFCYWQEAEGDGCKMVSHFAASSSLFHLNYTLLTEHLVGKRCYNPDMANDTAPQKPKKRARRDRREEILQAASELFSHHGYRGTSLAAIATAVGLTEPGLLHYFPGKENLLQNVLTYRDQQDREKYAALVASEKLPLPAQIALMSDLVAHNETIPGLVRLFTVLVAESIREDHPSHAFFVQRYAVVRGEFEAFFANLDDTELSSEVDAQQLASLVIAMMDGLQIQWLLDPENVRMSEAFSIFSEILIGYLKR